MATMPGWARRSQQPGASVWVSHVGVMGPDTWTIFYCFAQAISRKLDGKWISGDLNHMPIWDTGIAGRQPHLLHHIAGPSKSFFNLSHIVQIVQVVYVTQFLKASHYCSLSSQKKKLGHQEFSCDCLVTCTHTHTHTHTYKYRKCITHTSEFYQFRWDWYYTSSRGPDIQYIFRDISTACFVLYKTTEENCSIICLTSSWWKMIWVVSEVANTACTIVDQPWCLRIWIVHSLRSALAVFVCEMDALILFYIWYMLDI